MKLLLFLYISLTFFLNIEINARSITTNSVKNKQIDTTISKEQVIIIAKKDAKKHFKNVGENLIVCFTTLTISPLMGWITPIFILKRPISTKKIKIPDSIYSKNDTYIKAYIEEISRIRKKRLWITYFVTTIFYVLFSILFIFLIITFLNNMFNFWI